MIRVSSISRSINRRFNTPISINHSQFPSTMVQVQCFNHQHRKSQLKLHQSSLAQLSCSTHQVFSRKQPLRHSPSRQLSTSLNRKALSTPSKLNQPELQRMPTKVFIKIIQVFVKSRASKSELQCSISFLYNVHLQMNSNLYTETGICKYQTKNARYFPGFFFLSLLLFSLQYCKINSPLILLHSK